MNLIDTHTHLFLDEFKSDRTAVVKSAISSGVTKMLLPNISKKTTTDMLSLCDLFPNNCFPMLGLHPCYVEKKTLEHELDFIKKEIKKNKYIAIGETGIDLYWNNSNLELQKEAFKFHIDLAKKTNLPIVIHVRDSFKEVLKLVNEMNTKSLSGVFHCFSGTISQANQIIELGNFYLGVGGVLTFKNSKLKDVLCDVSLDNIVLETDSPYLSPTPLRGKRNESKNILQIANYLAEIKKTTLKEIAFHTTNNANKLFKI